MATVVKSLAPPLWLYVSGLAVLVGAEVNAEELNTPHPDGTELEEPAHPGQAAARHASRRSVRGPTSASHQRPSTATCSRRRDHRNGSQKFVEVDWLGDMPVEARRRRLFSIAWAGIGSHGNGRQCGGPPRSCSSPAPPAVSTHTHRRQACRCRPGAHPAAATPHHLDCVGCRGSALDLCASRPQHECCAHVTASASSSTTNDRALARHWSPSTPRLRTLLTLVATQFLLLADCRSGRITVNVLAQTTRCHRFAAVTVPP